VSPRPPHREDAGTAAASGVPPPQLTAAALGVLAVLAEGDGTGRYPLAALIIRAAVPPRTATDVIARLTAAGWAEAQPAGEQADGARAVRLTPAGRTGARGALEAARAGIALARSALGPSSRPIPVPPGTPVTGPDVSAALIIRAFLGTPAAPCHYSELAARTGIPGTTLHRAIARMKAAGWVADARPPAPGRPPSPFALTPAGRAAAPAVLDAARAHLADIAKGLGAGPEPRPASRVPARKRPALPRDRRGPPEAAGERT
jgi:DNA-binding MarR family transcriptional regulator